MENYLPKDLISIIEEYSKGNENYENIKKEFNYRLKEVIFRPQLYEGTYPHKKLDTIYYYPDYLDLSLQNSYFYKSLVRVLKKKLYYFEV